MGGCVGLGATKVALGLGELTLAYFLGSLTDGVIQIVYGQFVFERAVGLVVIVHIDAFAIGKNGELEPGGFVVERLHDLCDLV